MADILIHAGMVLYLASYAVRDILWLRVITVIAGSALMPAYYFRPDPVLPAIAWNAVFVAVNLFWIVRLIRERRPVQLSAEAERLRNLAFQSLSAREMQKLLSFAHWADALPGEVLIEEGVTLDRLVVLVRGSTEVKVRGERVGSSGAGRFLGDVSFLSGKETSAEVTASEPTRYVWWKSERLRNFMDNHPDLRSLLLMQLGSDLATKLRDR